MLKESFVWFAVAQGQNQSPPSVTLVSLPRCLSKSLWRSCYRRPPTRLHIHLNTKLQGPSYLLPFIQKGHGDAVGLFDQFPISVSPVLYGQGISLWHQQKIWSYCVLLPLPRTILHHPTFLGKKTIYLFTSILCEGQRGKHREISHILNYSLNGHNSQRLNMQSGSSQCG